MRFHSSPPSDPARWITGIAQGIYWAHRYRSTTHCVFSLGDVGERLRRLQLVTSPDERQNSAQCSGAEFLSRMTTTINQASTSQPLRAYEKPYYPPPTHPVFSSRPVVAMQPSRQLNATNETPQPEITGMASTVTVCRSWAAPINGIAFSRSWTVYPRTTSKQLFEGHFLSVESAKSSKAPARHVSCVSWWLQ
jgi:hypothetical protein